MKKNIISIQNDYVQINDLNKQRLNKVVSFFNEQIELKNQLRNQIIKSNNKLLDD